MLELAALRLLKNLSDSAFAWLREHAREFALRSVIQGVIRPEWPMSRGTGASRSNLPERL